MNNLPVVRSPWRIVILLLGFTFLYAPMLMLVIYSFNKIGRASCRERV